MGRRKERRLAALSAAGRRVKLDLSTEPSGDLGGSSAQEDVGGDGDLKTPAEFQSSETSSGQQLRNPLLLLEQYSDEEPDECFKEVNGFSAADDALNNTLEANIGDSTEPNIQKTKQFVIVNETSEDQLEKLGEGSSKEINSDDFQRQSDNNEVAVCNVAPDKGLGRTENIISGWKMVLHEESNLYYYWNIETGETSWELPDDLSQEVDKTSDNNGITNIQATSDNEKQVDLSDEEGKVDAANCSDENNNSNQGDGGHLLGSLTLENGSNKTLSWQLIKNCESLLETLNSVKGSDSHHLMKYINEIEIRLEDVKALTSHGSSLLPFWLHTKTRIKQLEDDLHGLIPFHNSAWQREFEDKADCLKDVVAENGHVHCSSNASLSAIGEPKSEEVECGAAKSDHEINEFCTTLGRDAPVMSSSCATRYLQGKSETDEADIGSEYNLRTSLQTGEDVDMDVDMELEAPSSINSSHQGVSTESDVTDRIADPEIIMQDQAVSGFSVGEWIPPVPPDHNPYPPPPPDDELYPPPPPDESLDASYTSSQLGSLPIFPLSGDYAVSYPVPSLQYYGQTDSDVAGASLYAQPAHLPHYYDAVPKAYSVTPLVANSIDTAAYYGLQSEGLYTSQLIVSESSDAISEPIPGTVDPSLVNSSNSNAEAGSSVPVNTDPEAVPFTDKCVRLVTYLDTQPAVETSATGSIGASLTSGSSKSSKPSKTQYKVPRAKKRAVAVVSTSRTNKKVSGLVDKWKAAKEEMQAEDEEADDAYELLEKKRQREIEEWRANQVATGAAKDNANFQPLGGDWRERVKRKKAEMPKETEQSLPNGPKDGNQKPDLVELAKGLPSGWQAYWDESSKQVYYGNVLTSETTWTRPKV